MSNRYVSLRREVGLFGSFSMGFADVGADIFVALGLVTLYAGGYAPIAFLVASICYITTGLVYAELSSLYPYAGGGASFCLRAGSDLLGFLTGWAILLDYTLDIGLFSIASAGYLSYLFPEISGTMECSFLGIPVEVSLIGFTAFTLTMVLIGLNLLGIKESSAFNVVFVASTLAIKITVLILGFLFAFSLSGFLEQLKFFGNSAKFDTVTYFNIGSTNLENFIYAITLAMSSFIGIESIAQAAEETRNPWRYIPRAFKYAIISVVAFTLLFSILGLGVLGWEGLSTSIYNPIAALASKIPTIGVYLSTVVALVAFTITLVSTNTGIIGASRVAYSMAKFYLLPRVFSRLHHKTAVPYTTILFFGTIGALIALSGNLEFAASLYNFGALLSYVLVNLSHIALRLSDRDAYRPWKTPFNVRIKNGVEVSIVAVIGLLSTATMFTLTVLYHSFGRLFGTIWVIAGVAFFLAYRKYKKMNINERVGIKYLRPALPRIRTIVLSPAYLNEEVIHKAVSRILRPMHELYLTTLIEVEDRLIKQGIVKIDDIKQAMKDGLAILVNACKLLSKDGFVCNHVVIVGDYASLIRYARKIRADQLVVLAGRRVFIKREIEHKLIRGLRIPIEYLDISTVWAT